MSYSVAISVFSLRGLRKGRGGWARNVGHEHDFCRAQKAENTDPRTNSAVKYATARGNLKSEDEKPININNFSGLFREWVGVKFVYVLPFSGKKRETHKHNSQELSGKGRKSPWTVPG